MDRKECAEEVLSINDFPNEILECILSSLSRYRDYKNAMLVCHRWHCVMKGIAEREYTQFHEGLTQGLLSWTSKPPAPGPTITERYSQSACYLNKCLYVFGGCTDKNTTFNDLWKLDLSTAEWIRPLAMGTYPSPKAYASLVSHKERLVLFGGWSHPTPLSLHQSARFFSQLHIYTPEANIWEEIVTFRSPQGLAGHGASVVGNSMIVFGGSKINGVSCNEVWVLDFNENEWTLKTILGNKPLPRYGHAQIVIDDLHILIVGGCGGANMQFVDVWLLLMDPEGWRWQEISVLQPQNCAPQLWCHPACKTGDKLVVLSKMPKAAAGSPPTNYNPEVRSPKSPSVSATKPSDTSQRCEAVSRSPVTSTGNAVHCCCCQEVSLVSRMSLSRSKRTYPETSESSSQESSSDNDDTAGHRLQSARSARSPTQRHGSAASGGYRRPSSLPVGGLSTSAASNANEPSTSALSSHHGNMDPPVLPPADMASRSPVSPAGSPSDNAGHPGGRSGLPSIRPNAMRNRQKQLEMLKRYEERIKGQRNKEARPPHPGACCHGAGGPCKVLYPSQRSSQNPMYVHTLDLSQVLRNQTVTWLPLSDYGLQRAPEETIFYSLVEGRGELIMFGGIQTDMNNMRRHTQHSEVFSNTVYFLGAKNILR